MTKSYMPETRYEMKRASYELVSTKKCQYCPVMIEWWKTTKGKFVPFDPPTTEHPDDELSVRHDCRANRSAAPSSPAVKPLTLDQERMRALNLLAAQMKARVVLVILDDGGYLYSVRRNVSAEDIRHDLIAGANNVKRDMEAEHGS